MWKFISFECFSEHLNLVINLHVKHKPTISVKDIWTKTRKGVFTFILALTTCCLSASRTSAEEKPLIVDEVTLLRSTDIDIHVSTDDLTSNAVGNLESVHQSFNQGGKTTLMVNLIKYLLL